MIIQIGAAHIDGKYIVMVGGIRPRMLASSMFGMQRGYYFSVNVAYTKETIPIFYRTEAEAAKQREFIMECWVKSMRGSDTEILRIDLPDGIRLLEEKDK